MLVWPVQAPPPMSPPIAQVATNDPYPLQMGALLKAKDWAGLADWFEIQPPALRGRHYESWLQALNRSQRWGRLLEVCEALQPQLEAKTGPRLGTYRLYRAQALAKLGRHVQAAQAFAENGRLGYLEGFANACGEASSAQDWNGLLGYSEELIQKQPQEVMGHAYRAHALSRLGRHSEAATAHAESGRLGFRDGLPNACTEARLSRDWDHLLTYSTELLLRKPDDPLGLASKGEALARLDRFLEAEPLLRAALEKDPQIAYAWNNLGRCLNEKKAWEEAAACLDRALTLDPGQPEALYNRGRSRFELKRYKDSRDDFRAALALIPGDPVLVENLRQAERYAALPPPKAVRKR